MISEGTLVHTLYLVSVWLHILAAMTWIGGMIFLVVVLVPMLRRPAMRERAAELFGILGVRFRTVGWAALATLIVTGVFNILHRGYRLEQLFTGDVFRGDWGHVLALKLAFVAAVVVLSAVHDFWLGPRATKAAREGASAEARERSRRLASILGRTTFTAALAIVALAVTLVRG